MELAVRRGSTSLGDNPEMAGPDTNVWEQAWSIVSQALTVLGVPAALVAGVGLYFKRKEKLAAERVVARHDIIEFQSKLAGIADEQVKRAFEWRDTIIIELKDQNKEQGATIKELKAQHEECEGRLSSLESTARDRRTTVDAEIEILKSALRAAGFPLPAALPGELTPSVLVPPAERIAPC